MRARCSARVSLSNAWLKNSPRTVAVQTSECTLSGGASRCSAPVAMHQCNSLPLRLAKPRCARYGTILMKDTNAIKSVVHGDHPALRDGDYVETGAFLFDGGHSLINGLPDKFWPLILGHAALMMMQSTTVPGTYREQENRTLVRDGPASGALG